MPSTVARALRALGFLQKVRGWRRVVESLSPPSDEPFEVTSEGAVYSGNLSSYIDREVWFYGRYEDLLIRSFLGSTAPQKRRLCLDIGGNSGNHALAFGQVFEVVHVFEPNPEMLPQLRRNVALNPGLTIQVHPIGLGDHEGLLPFFNIHNGNLGLGTFSPVEQYDQPLVQVGEARIRRGDDVVSEAGIERVDAIKIDVQGLEPEVLRGLSSTLQRDRPVVWLEVGLGTQSNIGSLSDLEGLFPYPIDAEVIGRGPASEALESGNYLVRPR